MKNLRFYLAGGISIAAFLITLLVLSGEDWIGKIPWALLVAVAAFLLPWFLIRLVAGRPDPRSERRICGNCGQEIQKPDDHAPDCIAAPSR